MSRATGPRPRPWLTLAAVEAALPAMEAVGAAEVARGVRPSTVTDGGFVGAYRYANGEPDVMADLPATRNQSWAQRRADFVARHTAQVEQRGEQLFRGGIPTPRLLGLIAWAYAPPELSEELGAWYDAGAPGTAAQTRRNSTFPDRRRQLQFEMTAPVLPELQPYFTEMVEVYDAKSKLPGLTLTERHADAADQLAAGGFIKIVKRHPPRAYPWDVPFRVYEFTRTKKGEKAVETMRAARDAYREEYQQVGLFGARTNRGSSRGDDARLRQRWADLDHAGALIQTVLFAKDDWTPARARTWLRSHALLGDDPDDDGPTVLRFRQADPAAFKPGTFRTIPFREEGVQAVVAVPKP